jgi:hypothetical protein
MANHNVEWITSQKGRSKLSIDNYLFESNGKGKVPGIRYWTCATSNCPVSAKTNGTNLIDISGAVNGDHGHVNDVTEIANLKLKVVAYATCVTCFFNIVVPFKCLR